MSDEPPNFYETWNDLDELEAAIDGFSDAELEELDYRIAKLSCLFDAALTLRRRDKGEQIPVEDGNTSTKTKVSFLVGEVVNLFTDRESGLFNLSFLTSCGPFPDDKFVEDITNDLVLRITLQKVLKPNGKMCVYQR